MNCATELFQQLLKNVSRKAQAAEKATATPADFSALVAALTAFYNTFGTGFIDRLDLMAYGIFEASLDRDSDTQGDTFRIGGGVAVSLPLFGAEGASEYCKTHMDEHAKVTFAARSFGRPPDSRAAQWADTARSNLDGKGIDEVLSPAAWKEVAPESVADPENPNLEYSPLPLPDIPLPDLPGILGTAIKALQYNVLGLADGSPLPDAPAVDNAIKAELGSLNAEAKATEETINAKALCDDQRTEADASAPTRTVRSLRAAETSGGDTSASPSLPLGGYSPSGYRYKAWKDIFPELDISLPRTISQIVFGQSLVWFSIRGIFAQYLDFCAHFPGVVLDAQGHEILIRNAARQFRTALDEVGEELTRRLMDKTSKPDLNFLHEMESRLKKQLDANYFKMYEHYRHWIDNYEWLKQVPFGVVAVAERDGQYFYQQNPEPNCPIQHEGNGYTPADSISPPDLITLNAYRLYPIISTKSDGGPHFVWVGAPSRLTGDHDDAVRRFSGLLSFAPDPRSHPSYRPDEAVNPFDQRKIPFGEVFDETTLPVLIQQSAAAADEIRNAENESGWWRDRPRSNEDCLQQRWEVRKSMFGMHLYPGVGDDDGFSPAGNPERLLKVAGKLAHEASQYATVQPDKKSSGKNDNDEYGALWQLDKPEGVWAAYSPAHAAMFFWGPENGPGLDQNVFERCPVRLVPIGYRAVENAVAETSDATPTWMTSGGGPMWMKPRTELLDMLGELASDPGEK